MLSRKEQKFIKSLKVKKYRTREKCFLVEGEKNVNELLHSDFEIEILIGTETFFAKNFQGSCRKEVVKTDLLTQLGTFKSNEDAIAVAKMKVDGQLPNVDKHHLFVLDGVSDPGNVGTIIRTLDWFGFDQLVCSLDCAEFYHPKVISSTMGSFTRVSVHSMELTSFFQRNKLPVYAADMHGEAIATCSFSMPSVIVMGSESHGISDEVRPYVTDFVKIPAFGKAESLNVGVATGIIASYLRMSL